jgi:Fic family protein
VKLPLAPPDPWHVLGRSADSVMKIFTAGVLPTVGEKYRHWENLRHLTPPGDLTHEEWWAGIKLARQSLLRPLPLADSEGRPFAFAMPDPAWEMVHRIDQEARGAITFPELVANDQSRKRYLVSSLIEEAITSSQLEGASTTARVAKEMIKSGRAPRNISERMILNNYRTMSSMQGWSSGPLTPDRIYELHRILTADTLDDPSDAGRPQQPGDVRMAVVDRSDGTVLHQPPPAELLPERLDALCKFANGAETSGFMHPVIRSILVHFWLSYDHPFSDGNGRTARALFYWSMLRQGYWLTEFLSISRILKKATAQYARSFLYTESDDLDTTYFLLYQLSVMCRAIDELHEYLARKIREVRKAEELLRDTNLNHRQLAVIGHALRNHDAEYTFRTHMTSHRVVYESARSDLLELERLGFLVRTQIGRQFVFRPARDLSERLNGAKRGGGNFRALQL